MVQSIGPNTVNAADRSVVPVVQPTAAATGKSPAATSQQLALSAIAFDFGKVSPVDEKRVEEVKRAVRNGTYPIAPETIADRLLALKLYWSPKK